MHMNGQSIEPEKVLWISYLAERQLGPDALEYGQSPYVVSVMVQLNSRIC